MLTKISYLIAVIGIGCSAGCASTEKQLFTSRIFKDQVPYLKSAILEQGYERTTKEDFYYRGAKRTSYIKKVIPNNNKSDVTISLSFKENEIPADFYTNSNIWIWNEGNIKSVAIDDEINKIELLLYNRLIEASGGKVFVKRGAKEIYK